MQVQCSAYIYIYISLRWRHNDHNGGSNHQPLGCLLNRLVGRKSKKTSKLRVTGLCVGNPRTRASYAENVSIMYGNKYDLYQSSASLAFVWGIHRWPVNSPHKGPVTPKMFPCHYDILVSPREMESNEAALVPFCNRPFLINSAPQ